MIKDFIRDCLFFKSERPIHVVLGVYAWANIVLMVVKLLYLIHQI